MLSGRVMDQHSFSQTVGSYPWNELLSTLVGMRASRLCRLSGQGGTLLKTYVILLLLSNISCRHTKQSPGQHLHLLPSLSMSRVQHGARELHCQSTISTDIKKKWSGYLILWLSGDKFRTKQHGPFSMLPTRLTSLEQRDESNWNQRDLFQHGTHSGLWLPWTQFTHGWWGRERGHVLLKLPCQSTKRRLCLLLWCRRLCVGKPLGKSTKSLKYLLHFNKGGLTQK